MSLCFIVSAQTSNKFLQGIWENKNKNDDVRMVVFYDNTFVIVKDDNSGGAFEITYNNANILYNNKPIFDLTTSANNLTITHETIPEPEFSWDDEEEGEESWEEYEVISLLPPRIDLSKRPYLKVPLEGIWESFVTDNMQNFQLYSGNLLIAIEGRQIGSKNNFLGEIFCFEISYTGKDQYVLQVDGMKLPYDYHLFENKYLFLEMTMEGISLFSAARRFE
jgi:hypothetical protein